MLTITAIIVLTIGSTIASPIDPKIVGGKPAVNGQFPYQVSLRRPLINFHFCGGSIISSKWILTAAHCVRGVAPSGVVAVVGTNYLNFGGRGYGVSKIISHNSYDPHNYTNDISVLRIKGKFQFSDKIKPIALASAEIAPGVSLTLSGWGITRYPSNQPPNHLQYISFKSITVLECQQKLPGREISKNNQCIISTTGEGACKGDSGGPLVYGDYQQVGVVSWGIPCALGLPDVFTSVAAYRNWIKGATGV